MSLWRKLFGKSPAAALPESMSGFFDAVQAGNKERARSALREIGNELQKKGAIKAHAPQPSAASSSTPPFDPKEALFEAVRKGEFERVRKLLGTTASGLIFAKDEDGRTPLQLATALGEAEVAELLLAHTCRRLVASGDGDKPLIVASSWGRLDVVQALLAAKADIDASNTNYAGNTALIAATRTGHLNVVQALLFAKANVNAKNRHGITALHVASSEEAVKALIAANADIDAKDESGDTPLLKASFDNRLDVVHALITAKADVNAKNSKGDTALMSASSFGHLSVVHALIAAKADINAKDNDGRTALMSATRYPEVAAVLRQHGAKE